MSLESMLVEMGVLGCVFTQAEVFFTSVLYYEHERSAKEVEYPLEKKAQGHFGHSYPVMFALGALSAPALHYVVPGIEEVGGPIAAYAAFGAGVGAIEYVTGKLGFAQWKEVYRYLESRVHSAVECTRRLPLTIGDGSVFLPFLPLWAGVGVGVSLLHQALHDLPVW